LSFINKKETIRLKMTAMIEIYSETLVVSIKELHVVQHRYFDSHWYNLYSYWF